MIGQLFTQDFLSASIADTPAWKSVTDAELDNFVAQIKAVYAPFKMESNLNEPVTENEIIVKVLSRLGWTDILTQQVASKSRREDVPDMLLFPNAAAKTAALKEKCCGSPTPRTTWNPSRAIWATTARRSSGTRTTAATAWRGWTPYSFTSTESHATTRPIST